MNELLKKLDACKEARVWAKDKTWKEVFETCERGDWLLWLFFRVNAGDKRIFLAKAHCANTVRHLMKDERSTKAIDAAIKFANGEITAEELRTAADAAYAAAFVSGSIFGLTNCLKTYSQAYSWSRPVRLLRFLHISSLAIRSKYATESHITLRKAKLRWSIACHEAFLVFPLIAVAMLI